MKWAELPSQEYLLSILSYDQDTGRLTWLPKPNPTNDTYIKIWNARWANKTAGNQTPTGYIAIGVDNKIYLAHRLIFKLMTGRDPVAIIDHRDCDKANNRWENLREATHAQNAANVPPRSRSGIKGVWRHKNGWRFSTSKFFNSLEEAKAASDAYHQRQHGDFAYTAANDNTPIAKAA